MVLVLGMSTTAMADVNSPVVDNTPTINSPTVDNTPSDSIPSEITVEWSETKPWTVVAENVNTSDGFMEYVFRIWKDGELIDGLQYSVLKNHEISVDISATVGVYGAGEYYVAVFVWGDDGIVSEGISEKLTYTKPDKQLATPANFSIDTEVAKLTFDAVEGAEFYDVWAWVNVAGNEVDKFRYLSIDAKELKDNKYEGSIGFILSDLEWIIAEYPNSDITIQIGVCAVTTKIDEIMPSDYAKQVVYEKVLSKEQVKENFEEAFEALENNEPIPAVDALSGISNETITELLETDAEFAEKVAELDEFLVEAMGDDYKGATSETDVVDITKVSVVGLAINAYWAEEVELTFAEPAKKAEVDEKYENAVQLDISLLVDGEAMEDLSVPVTITMPIPTGVAKENLVILHYHGNATEPEVIVPTVNADGTMTFIVDGFSTFVVTNEVVEETPAPAPETPKTGDTSTTALVCSLLFLVAGVVLVMKRNAFAK